MTEKLLTGSLVVPGGDGGSDTRVVLRNKIIFDDTIYNNIRNANTRNNQTLENAISYVTSALGFNPYPGPALPYFTQPGYIVDSDLEEYTPTVLIDNNVPILNNLTIEFNSETYNTSTTPRIYEFSQSYPSQYAVSYLFGYTTGDIYLGASIIYNPNQFDCGISYDYLIGPSSNIVDGIIVNTTFKSVIFSIAKQSDGRGYTSFVKINNTRNYPLLLNYKPDDPAPPELETTDPYAPGGTSKPGGGNGSFDITSDPVDFSQLPTLSAVNAGFISLFNPTNAELQSLASKLWSTDFLDILTRFFSDPADVIISLSIVPVTPPISGRMEVQAGFIPTGVTMNKISTQYVAVSCGSLEVVPFYDAALDYAPFTKLSIFLPFIGVRSLDIDECMGKTLAINYNIDLLSGSCVCEIKCKDAVLYSFNGNIVSEIPISSRSFDTLISASMSAVTAIGTAVATGGATTTSAVSATANAIMAAKPEIIRSGNTSSMTGLLAGKVPYLIYQIPNQSVPENANTFTGYPSNITATLGELSGFTQVSEIHIEGVPGTDGEVAELDQLLKEGVIL